MGKGVIRKSAWQPNLLGPTPNLFLRLDHLIYITEGRSGKSFTTFYSHVLFTFVIFSYLS